MKDMINVLLESVQRDTTNLRIFLAESDFFTAPASTKYHLCEKGGLARHSMNVYDALVKLNDNMGLGLLPDSMKVCGLLHDVCKVNFYALEDKRVKIGNEWTTQNVYVVKDQCPLGHGEKSVIVLQDLMTLWPEEIMAIRWHMGAWDAEGVQRKTLGQAMDKCKLLKALMVADQMATYFIDTPRTDKV